MPDATRAQDPRPQVTTRPCSAPRRLIADVASLAGEIPLFPVERTMSLAGLAAAREAAAGPAATRIGWAAIFMKAYALVARDMPVLRTWLVRGFPAGGFRLRPKLATSSESVATLAVNRVEEGEDRLLWARLQRPDALPLPMIQQFVADCGTKPIEEMFKRQLELEMVPGFLRRTILRWNMNSTSPKRAARIGTFSLSTLAGLGATNRFHPTICTTSLSYAPLEADGRCLVTLIADHRVLDGAAAARALTALEEVLAGTMHDELVALATRTAPPTDRSFAAPGIPVSAYPRTVSCDRFAREGTGSVDTPAGRNIVTRLAAVLLMVTVAAVVARAETAETTAQVLPRPADDVPATDDPVPALAFRDLFNGKDLTGWVNVNTAPDTWSVKGGLLVCSGQPIGVMRSDRQYENFILHVEWRHMRPGGNSGVFVWSDATATEPSRLPKGMEVQMLDLDWINQHPTRPGVPNHIGYVSGELFGAGGMTAVPDNPRGNRSMSHELRCKGHGNWNVYDAACIDGTVKLAINGKFVNSIRNASVRKGYLCLESEGSEIHFRSIRILELPPGLASAEQTAKELD